jgi:cell division protein FtsB
MTLQQRFIRFIFYIECFVVLGFYFFGGQGLQALTQLHKELDKQKREIENIEEDVRQLEQEITAWEQDPFYIEKAARENLAMSYEGEDIYVIK